MKPNKFHAAVCAVLVVVSGLVLLGSGTKSAVAQIFITTGGQEPLQNSPGEIRRVNLDGSGLTTLVTLPSNSRPTGIAVDKANGQLFWNDWNRQVTERANIDGTSVTTIQVHPSCGLNHIALDVAGNKIYSAAGACLRHVSRFNLDGSGSFQVIDNGFFPDGIALDLANGHVYWGDAGLIPTGIRRVDLNGANNVQLINPALFPATNNCNSFGIFTYGRGRGMALDLAAGKMYFGGHPRSFSLTQCLGLGEIWRANLDGTGLQLLVSGLDKVGGVALDTSAGKVYWTDTQAGKIQRANLDGTGVQDVVTGLITPQGIALITGINVPVDIKPQSCPNPLNVKSKGVLPVAILGTANFDATQVDVTTVTLEGVSPLRSNLEDVATPFDPFTGKENALDCNEDAGDGLTDLTLKFDRQAVVGALGAVNDGDVIVVPVSGKLLDGTTFDGEDVIVIKKKK